MACVEQVSTILSYPLPNYAKHEALVGKQRNNHMATASAEGLQQRVRGVRIACSGERVAGAEAFTTHDVPLDHDVFGCGELCPVSKLVNMPLLVSKVRPSLHYAATRNTFSYELSGGHYSNVAVRKLMICCDQLLVQEKDSGAELLKTPRRWMEMVGSVIVVRQDGVPLYAHHLKVLLDFIETVTVHNQKIPRIPDSHRCLPKGSGMREPSLLPLREAFTVRIVHKPASAVEVVAQFTSGGSKDHYMCEKFYWRHDIGESGRLLRLPSPYPLRTDSRKFVFRTRRNEIRERYYMMDHIEKYQEADSWKEALLLRQIHSLKCRLLEADGDLNVGSRQIGGEAALPERRANYHLAKQGKLRLTLA
ncbi:hypothetical protein LTR37_002705 [Vermiconidia calcicola]|uniref:Uncharacterized protein n=1 Tax=Vermiconidia calcicola TaxID=1690605 RepID=A0ACC3NRY3_9PEZI|nr:hypothetical protein LTR37_002705 [Vermiconidia calcicola]